MNSKGGAIEVFAMLFLGLLGTGFFLVNIFPTTFPLTQSSTWSGDGTTPGLLFEGIGIIMFMLVIFWSYKQNVSGATNF